MAFATSNPRTGTMGDLKVFAADWTGSSGDDAGTITLKGGRVYMLHVYNQDATSNEDRPTPCSVSVSSGTITVSVYNHSDVSQGRLLVVYL